MGREVIGTASNGLGDGISRAIRYHSVTGADREAGQRIGISGEIENIIVASLGENRVGAPAIAELVGVDAGAALEMSAPAPLTKVTGPE